MMQRWQSSLGLTILAAFLGFQNCSPFLAGQVSEESIYPYKTRPGFFVDLKLVEVDQNGGTPNYLFDLAISYADDPRLAVEYLLAFASPNGDQLCPTQRGIVSRRQGDNHIRHACRLPVVAETLVVELRAAGPSEVKETFKFEF